MNIKERVLLQVWLFICKYINKLQMIKYLIRLYIVANVGTEIHRTLTLLGKRRLII